MDNLKNEIIKWVGICSLTFLLIFGTSHVFKMMETKKMVQTAQALISQLDGDQRQKAVLSFKDPWRYSWHYLPDMVARKGLKIKEMNEGQRKLAFELLETGLSEKGYSKVRSIMDLEEVLYEASGWELRDPELYYFSIYGDPSMTEPWGWKVEGHHVSLNYTVVGGKLLAMEPRFFGSNPAEVKAGPKKGLRVLKAEEDMARAFLHSLNDEQRRTAIFSTEAYPDIVTGNSSEVGPLVNEGIEAGALTGTQLDQLLGLLEEYLSYMPAALASVRYGEIREKGIGNIYFGWAGGIEPGDPHYYRIQGPTFLIEYDKTQNDANHIHTVWRDFDGDFGRDILKEHYLRDH